VKPHLVSKEALARQVYRYSRAYRFAAFVLFGFLLLQVPAVVWLIYERQADQDRRTRAGQLAAEAARIASDRKALADTEKKLKRIQGLAPVLRARLPISAVLGKIEQLASQDLALSQIVIDAGQFQPVQIETGLFQVPRQINIVITGQETAQGSDAYKHLAGKLLESLPPGSKIADMSLAEGQPFKTFRLALNAPTNGNYFGLGVTKISTQNSL
jgi:hypothetical protein